MRLRIAALTIPQRSDNSSTLVTCHDRVGARIGAIGLIREESESIVVYITAVHMVGGERHEHIAAVRWRNASSGATDESTREAMVRWIRDENGDARVSDGQHEVRVGVVDASPPYIRTFADNVWTDNLLALPRY